MTIHTVQELIELLEEFDPESPIALATQPNYPLAYHLAGVTEMPAACECEDLMEEVPDVIDEHHADCPASHDTEELPTVWLLEGNHTDRPYDVPQNLWSQS